MKRAIKLWALLLIVFTVCFLGVIAVSAYTYTMEYTIYYKTTDGTTLGIRTGTVNGDATNTVSVSSPSYDGYILVKSSDSTVTGSMISWNYPSSNYVRKGTGSYTVKYEPRCTLTINYLYEDGSQAAPSQTVSGKSGGIYRVSSPSVEHHTPDRSLVSGRYAMSSDSVNVYYYRTYYTVSYDANGGTGVPEAGSKASGISYQLPLTQPTRYGYTFLGWAKTLVVTIPEYYPGGWIGDNSDLTLYAVWKPITYTITYNANGGTNAPAPQTKYHGTTLQLSADEPTRTGYAFMGWATYATATAPTYAPRNNWGMNQNQILYAVWEKLPEQYTVYYHPNGGDNAPESQVKTEGVALMLSKAVPFRDGYTFRGWATSPINTTPTYRPGDWYSKDAGITLYAVWKVNTYTVTFDANGGSEAPEALTKTHGTALTLPLDVLTRDRYKFLGWNIDQYAEDALYLAGDTFTENGNITLYAVWEFINYDFSVYDINVEADDIYQYDTVPVRIRLDSWDEKNAYENIPIAVYLNGEQIYSAQADFAAYGINYVTLNLNIGSMLGVQTIEARVNWEDHLNETDSENNFSKVSFTVRKLVSVSAEAIEPNADYTVGTDVVTTFYILNDCAGDILPSDGITFNFEVFYEDDNGNKIVVDTQSRSNVVIPKDGRNIVYFKWSVPADCIGKLLWCQGKINSAGLGNEQDLSDNTAFFSVYPMERLKSQTPNTSYEATPPMGYDPDKAPPSVNSGIATWNEWVFENGSLILKAYGIRISDLPATVTPSAGCKSAVYANGKWIMRSGYGFSLTWEPTLTAVDGYLLPDSNTYTGIQNAYATFPEYGYLTGEGVFRTLEEANGVYCFVPNPGADQSARLHFIPIYVKNGDYTVAVTATEIWTPVGMITAIRYSNAFVIDGSLYDDWYS